MVRRRGPPSQGWKTFLDNHADGIAVSLDKDSPRSRTVKRAGPIVCRQSWADCITNVSGCDLRQAQGVVTRSGHGVPCKYIEVVEASRRSPMRRDRRRLAELDQVSGLARDALD